MLKIIRKNNKLLFILLSVILGLPSIFGLLHGGFPLTDDGNWMVIRFSAFYEVIRSGEIPVRFLTRLNNGFGYPVADFLYPLFMYLAVPIHLLKVNFVDTIKIILILSSLSSSLFSFLWLKKRFDNISSLIGSLFYTYFPYHLFDIYKRGSVGEVLALSIVPFIFWQIERKSLFFVSLGIAFLILSHNTLAFLFMPLIVIYIFLKFKKNFMFNLVSIFLGFGIASFFWIPAIYDQQFTVFNTIKISNFSYYFVNNTDLRLLGIAFLFLLLKIIFYLVRSKDKNFFLLFLAIIGLSFFTLSFSNAFWNLFPFANLIQFPFRIISLVIPLSAFSVSYLLSKEKKQKKILLIPIYILLILVSAWPFLLPKSYQNYPDSFYSTNQDTTTVKNEYMPKWIKETPSLMYKLRVEVINSRETPRLVVQNAKETSFELFLNKARTVQVNTIYFPGWNAYVNGERKNINYENNGLIQLKLDKGENNVRIVFEETGIRILSDFLSIISLLGLFVFTYFIKTKKD